MKVNIKNIADELQTISDGDCLFYNKITGETEWFGEELGNPNDLELDDIEEDENFVCLPSKWNINDYEIMEDFMNAQKNVQIQNQIFQAIKGKGAFRNFRAAVERNGLLDDWYKFKDSAYEQIVRDWCKKNGLETEQDDLRSVPVLQYS